MRKISSLFVRDDTDRRYVTEVVTPGAEWVLAGEGTASRKMDGLCVLLNEADPADPYGRAMVRRSVKDGQDAPDDFLPVEHDAATGKTFGWQPAVTSGFAKFVHEALANSADDGIKLPPGTYELCGPKINGNPEGFPEHYLFRHGHRVIDIPDRSYAALRAYLLGQFWPHGWEGVVFVSDDGSKMAKIKAKDMRP